MRKALFVVVLALLVALPVGAKWRGGSGRAVDVPDRYAPGLDGKLVREQDPVDGRTLAVWPYRSGNEFSIAVSLRNADGEWGDPEIIGLDDGLDQVQPAVTVDGAGNAYLAFAVAQTGKIQLSMLAAGATEWSQPALVGLPASAPVHSPALRVVGDRLVLGFRYGGEIGLVDLELPQPPTVSPHGIEDGPDGFPLPGHQSGGFGNP